MIDGMIANPRPFRVAFMSRIFGWTWRSPSPWLVKVYAVSSVLTVGFGPGSVGLPRPDTTAIGRITPSSKPRWGSLVKPTAACSEGRTSASTWKVAAWPPKGVPAPVRTRGRRA